jgi:3',5'-cyclic-AMP phosphodiesterase
MLIQLSDLHLRAGEGQPGQAQPGAAQRLQHALRQVAALRPSADAVLVSGDLVDDPSAAAYANVRALLESLAVPVYAMAGNHDDRDLLRAHFPSGQDHAHAGAPVRFAVNCGTLRLVACDSTDPGSDAGVLDREQLAWLGDTLAEQPETPTLLALHHPPVLTGVRSMDAIALAAEDRIALEALLGSHPQVQTVTCGHVHTTMITSFAGRPLLICPSTNSALQLDLRPREDVAFAVSGQPLGFAVHELIDGRLVSHVQTVKL